MIPPKTYHTKHLKTSKLTLLSPASADDPGALLALFLHSLLHPCLQDEASLPAGHALGVPAAAVRSAHLAMRGDQEAQLYQAGQGHHPQAPLQRGRPQGEPGEEGHLSAQ